MKKLVILLVTFVAILFIIPSLIISSINKASYNEATEQNITVNTPLNFDYFKVGNNIEINNTIDGDVFLIGKSVIINSKITGSVFVIAESLEIKDKSEITNSLYSLSQNAKINGAIGENLRNIGEKLNVAGIISKNASFISSDVTFSGSAEVGRDLYGIADKFVLDGRVSRDVILKKFLLNNDTQMSSTGDITINGRIGGDFRYKDLRPTLTDRAIVLGKTIAEEDDNVISTKNQKYELLTSIFMSGITAFLIGIILINSKKGILLDSVSYITKYKLNTFLSGLMVFILSLAASFVLGISIIGIPLALLIIGILLVIFYIYLMIPFGLIIGNLILSKQKNTALSLFTGIFVISIIWLNPSLSGILTFIMGIYSLGSIYKILKRIKFSYQ